MPSDQITAMVEPARPNFVLRRPRGIGQWIIVYPLLGKVTVRVGKLDSHATVGSIWLIRPSVAYELRTRTEGQNYREIWANFTPRATWHPWLEWPEALPGIMRLDLASAPLRRQIVCSLVDMAKWTRTAVPMRQELALNALERALLLCHEANPAHRVSPSDVRLRGLLDFIQGHLDDPDLSVGRLAREAGLSEVYLRQLFVRHLKLSPRRFVEEQRIQRAIALLETTGLLVKEVAARVGFRQAFHFTNRFRRLTGRSPSEVRRRSHLT